jgi:hypothetical protein
MGNLYMVQIKGRWENFYVLATSFDDAASKVERYLINRQEDTPDSVVGYDGSLNLSKPKDPIEISRVEQLTNQIIE